MTGKLLTSLADLDGSDGPERPAPVPDPKPKVVKRPARPRKKPTVVQKRTRDRFDRAFIAKQVWLWPEQIDGLDEHAKRLERARPTGVGERITANTLLRAITEVFLTDQAGHVTGRTEADIVESVRKVLSR